MFVLNTKHIQYVFFIRLNAILNMNNYGTCQNSIFHFFFLSLVVCKTHCPKIEKAQINVEIYEIVFLHFVAKNIAESILLTFSRSVCLVSFAGFLLLYFSRLRFVLCMCNDRMRIYVFYDSGEIIK